MITQDKVIDAVAGLAPWLAPVPTAYLIGRATAQHLEWPIWVAVAGAIVVECIGLTVANQALVLYNYNQDKRKSDPRAPLWLAILLVIVYLAVAVILTVLLDTLPDVAMYAPVIFPLLSLTGVTALALRADHQRRMRVLQNEKDERKLSRKLQENSGSLQKVTGKLDWRKLPDEDRVLIAGMTTGQISTTYRVSERTASNWRAAAQKIKEL